MPLSSNSVICRETLSTTGYLGLLDTPEAGRRVSSERAESGGAPRGLTGGQQEPFTATACGLSHVSVARAASTRLKRPSVGGSLSRTGHEPTARRPPPQTSLQHEVVSSTVIRPCSRELLPGTLRLLPTHSWGCVRPGSPRIDTHTHTAALSGLGQAIQNALARAIEGTLLIVIILVVRFSPVGFVLVSSFFPSVFLPLPYLKPTAYTHISCLVPRVSLVSLCFALTPLSSLQLSVSHSLDCPIWTSRLDGYSPSAALVTTVTQPAQHATKLLWLRILDFGLGR